MSDLLVPKVRHILVRISAYDSLKKKNPQKEYKNKESFIHFHAGGCEVHLDM